MVRKTNFSNIGVRGETKKEFEELKKMLNDKYIPDATSDDLMKILLEKNKKITLTPEELKNFIVKIKGVKF